MAWGSVPLSHALSHLMTFYVNILFKSETKLKFKIVNKHFDKPSLARSVKDVNRDRYCRKELKVD